MRLFRAFLACALTLCALACHPVREAVMRVTPGVPDPSGCVAPASRCAANVPEVCSASGRWWPATPASAPCPYGCVVDDGPDGGAYCAAANGGAR